MNKTISCYQHTPVLLRESIKGLDIIPDGIYVDMTYGGGGHSKEILKRIKKNGHLYAFDQDISVLDNLPENKNFTFTHCNFRYAFNFLKYFGISKVDGILVDLGVSSFHLDKAKRGFSFRYNDALDMRMNKSSKITAEEVLSTYTTKKLKNVFEKYGELTDADRIANLITQYRQKQKFKTTHDLVNILNKIVPNQNRHKYLAKVFQALRIEANKELDALKHMLNQSYNWLNTTGRLVVISYHSLEDKIVKNFLRNKDAQYSNMIYQNKEAIKYFRMINKKVIKPSIEEIKINNRSRSAKLRIAEKI